MNALHDPPPRVFTRTQARRPESARILYVEDDEGIRTISTQILAGSGYAVIVAEDGLEGWDVLHLNHFDLLITDNDMPRLTGLELVAKVQAKGMELPIILASGSLHLLARPAYQWLHLAATLQKPFAPEELLTTVQQVLRTSCSIQPEPQVFSPAFAEALSRVQPYRHGGINE